MLNDRLSALPEYMFPRYRALIAGVESPRGLRPIDLTVGEPRHAPPAFVAPILAQHTDRFGRYPPIEGTQDWRRAAIGFSRRRWGLPEAAFGEDNLLPLAGTREGLFLAALLVTPSAKAGARPIALMPNPLYQCYFAAACAAGAEPVLLPATEETGFLPDLDAISEEVWAKAAAFYLCSPSNPQGAVASLDYLKRAIQLARAHDCALLMDECYSEIYDGAPPPGALQACVALADRPDAQGDPFANVLIFQSLSKRSNLPGLRSGFVAGDTALIAAFKRLRSLGGPTVPMPVQAVAAAAWDDEAHVAENRRLYGEKFDAAGRALSGRAGYRRPEGGFYLWLDVGDGEEFAKRLWRDFAVRALPGLYLAETGADGINPGRQYLRIALVEDLSASWEGVQRLAEALGPAKPAVAKPDLATPLAEGRR